MNINYAMIVLLIFNSASAKDEFNVESLYSLLEDKMDKKDTFSDRCFTKARIDKWHRIK